MKKSFFISIFIGGLLILACDVKSQTLRDCPSDLNLFFKVNDDLNNLKQHQIICRSGQVFINWVLVHQNKDCLYLIEKSENGQNYRSIGVKVITAADFEIFYSFVDKNPDKKNTIYRLRKLDNNLIVND